MHRELPALDPGHLNNGGWTITSKGAAFELGERLAALDPGGMRSARGVHLLLVVTIAALAGSWIGGLAGAPSDAVIAIMTPVVGAHTLLFSLPGRRLAEALSIARFTGLALAVFAVAFAVGWGNLGFGTTPVQIAWVAAIALGFYLRRYGGGGFRFGMMLSLMFMFVVVFNPTREEAAWWLLAAVIGGLSAAIVATVAWRPSAMRAFLRQQDRFLDAVVARLRTQQVPADTAAPPPPHRAAHKAWEGLARLSDQAVSFAPAERSRLEGIVAASLRMVLALEVVAEDPDSQMQRASPTSPLRQALDDTVDLLSSARSDRAAIAASLGRLRRLRDGIAADRDRPGRERFHQARLIIGLLRIILSLQELASDDHAVASDRKMPEPSKAPASGAEKSDAKRLGLRLALQATVAAGITTAIGLIFSLEHAYWATLTVVLIIGANLGATVRRTLERVFGTAAGVAIAIAVLWFAGDNTVVLVILIALAFMPILVVIERYYVIAAGLIGFTVVTGLHIAAGLTATEALARAYDTLIGAAVGLTVAWLLVPIRSVDHVRKILARFRSDCRATIQDALAGKTMEASGAGRLQKDTGDLAAELSNIQTERLLARGTGHGTRRLQAHADSLAIYVALLASVLERLAAADLPQANAALVSELVSGLSKDLETPLDQAHAPMDVEDLTKRWANATKLDGSIPTHEAMWLIEVLIYGRKCLETLEGVRRLVADQAVDTRRRSR
ncbi:MAG: FUSC family protein [Pseudomonadota bacterium]